MARKLGMRRDKNPHLDEMSSDGVGVEFGQPLTNQVVPTRYMKLDNPIAEAPIDRKRMRQPRAESFGFTRRPKNFNDLSVGEAGAGVSQFRRAQFFSRVVGDGAGEDADGFDYDIPVAIATSKSADVRPRFWHISFFGISVVSSAAQPPVPESDILTAAARGQTSTVLKGRVQVYDESGSRFFDVNIHGTSSFSFYGWGVTTFILLPSLNGVAQGFEVNATNPGATPTFPGGSAENTLATGRIIPMFQNATQITDQVTGTTTAPSGAAGGIGVIAIPPGARAVRVRANIGAVPPLSAGYDINFAVIPAAGRPPAMGRIGMLPGRLESALVAIPNATFIVFDAGDLDPEIEWIATFVVEA